MMEDEFSETNFHPPTIFDSPVIKRRHTSQGHLSSISHTQPIAYEKTISNDGRGSVLSANNLLNTNHNNINNSDEFGLRRMRSHDLPPHPPSSAAPPFSVASLIRMESNGACSHTESQGTNYSPIPNPIFEKDFVKERAFLRHGKQHDSSSEEGGTVGDGSFYEGLGEGDYRGLDDWEYHNLYNGAANALDYDSDYAEDERNMMKWQARRLGLIYLGKEELEKHAQQVSLSEEEKIHYLLKK